VSLSAWLPGGELAEYRHVVDQHEMVGPPLEVGGVRYELIDALKTWRIVADVDFPMGNFLVDGGGLRGVLDWELAHLGDPAEDIGWLCARARRFGGPGRVGGFGKLDQFLTAYASVGGGRWTSGGSGGGRRAPPSSGR
ncbi:MAG TPA: phosphotransferase, partial [Acidimicrobiales bacterium]|nr:phosphotransferase [Acidimicrobiales bacterium]